MGDLSTENIKNIFKKKFDLANDPALTVISSILVRLSERLDKADESFRFAMEVIGKELDALKQGIQAQATQEPAEQQPQPSPSTTTTTTTTQQDVEVSAEPNEDAFIDPRPDFTPPFTVKTTPNPVVNAKVVSNNNGKA